MDYSLEAVGIDAVREAMRQAGHPWDESLMRDLALWGQRIVKVQFNNRDAAGRFLAGARSKTWPGIPWWAKVISANVGGKRGAIKTKEDAENAQRQPLRDQGALMKSFASSITADENSASFGSNLPYAAVHQTGGTQVFSFDAEKQKRFDYNVARTLGGSAPATTPKGRRSRAKQNWNPDYFAMRGALMKKDGQQVKIRQREMIPENIGNTRSDKQQINKIWQMWAAKRFGGAGAAP